MAIIKRVYEYKYDMSYPKDDLCQMLLIWRFLLGFRVLRKAMKDVLQGYYTGVDDSCKRIVTKIPKVSKRFTVWDRYIWDGFVLLTETDLKAEEEKGNAQS